MSAYVVEDLTLHRIVSYLSLTAHEGCAWDLEQIGYPVATDEQCERLAGDLYQMNCDAVDARYGKGESAQQTDGESVPGFKLVPVTPVEAYKACQCLLYQLSEGDIDKRPLYAALEGALSRIADQIISKLPSYEEAAWG